MIGPDGVPLRYTGNSGESLLAVLDRHWTPGIHSDCGGGDQEHTFAPFQTPYDYYSMGVSCGQCQVIIQEPFFSMLNKSPSTETRTMNRACTGLHENSRLACCV